MHLVALKQSYVLIYIYKNKKSKLQFFWMSWVFLLWHIFYEQHHYLGPLLSLPEQYSTATGYKELVCHLVIKLPHNLL